MQPRTEARPSIAGWLVTVTAFIFMSLSISAQAREVPASFSGLVEGLLPAVVNIATTQTTEGDEVVPPKLEGSPMEEFFREFFGDRLPESRRRSISALGSGFIIDPEGYVVTNRHVVEKADQIRVVLGDDRTFQAEVVGTDEPTDLALLKIDADAPLPSVGWGRSQDVKIGDWVIAIGNPFGLGGTVTTGVLSARARDIRTGPYDDFLQIDAAINRGSSGGPLFDVDGSVIGVNTVILSPTGGNIGIGFAIPSSTAQPVIAQLRKHGVVRRGWLGVQIQPMNERIANAVGLDEPRGALVADVVEDGPAAAAGLQSGDVILSFDGQTVEQTRDLPRIVANTEIGKTVPVTLWRDRSEMTVQVTVAERDEAQVAASRGEEQEDGAQQPGQSSLGMRLAPLDANVRERLGLKESVEGAVVTGLKPGGAAAQQGIQAGDVIVEVGQEAVSSPQDVARRIAEIKRQGQDSALLRINRGGTHLFVAVPV